MTVTATEFKLNLGKYLSLAKSQEIFITKNGRNIAKLTSPDIDKINILDSLVGILPPAENMDEESIKEERLECQ